MAVTPRKGLPYPVGSDVSARASIQNLATDLDNKMDFYTRTDHQVVDNICYHEDTADQNGSYIIINTFIPVVGTTYHVMLRITGFNQKKRNVIDLNIVFSVANNTITASTAEVHSSGSMLFSDIRLLSNIAGNVAIALLPVGNPNKIAFVVDAEFSGPTAVATAHTTGWVSSRAPALTGYTSLVSSLVSGGWVTLPLHYTWQNLDPVNHVTAKAIRVDGVVRLQGIITRPSGTDGHFSTLPVGMRPSANGTLIFSVKEAGGMGGRVDVSSNGDLWYVSGSASWVSLSSIQFPLTF